MFQPSSWQLSVGLLYIFPNNSTARSQLFWLYYGYHTFRWYIQGIRPVLESKMLLWVGLFPPHLIQHLRYKFQTVILNHNGGLIAD